MNKILPLLSAFILGAAFCSYELGWLVFIGLVPLLIFVQKSVNTKYFLLSVWAAGVVFYGIVNGWMLMTDTATWPNLSGTTAVIIIGICWMLASVIFSSGWLLWAWLTKKMSINMLGWQSAIFLPAIWVACEYFRSLAFSVFWSAPQATIGAHWNFGNLGLGATTTALAPISRLVGMFGLCFLVIGINILIIWLWNKRWLQSLVFIVVLVLLYTVSFFGFISNNTKEIPVGIVQLKRESPNYQQELLAASKNIQPELRLLVLPEYSSFFDEPNTTAKEISTNLIDQNNGLVIYSTGSLSTTRGMVEQYDTLTYAKASSEVVGRQEKSFLIPTGEYMPYVAGLILRLAGKQSSLQQFEIERSLVKSNSKEEPVRYKGLYIGGLACSGVISPQLYQSLAAKGTNILTNSASLGVFAGSKTYFEQSKAMARFHAIANNQPFLQATTGGYSYIIQPSGEFTVETNNKDFGLYTAKIHINQKSTPYSKFGEYFVWTSITLLLVVVYRRQFAVPSR